MRIVFAGLLLAVLAGCATSAHEEDVQNWMAMEQSRQARLDVVAAQCQTDLCLVMVAQETSKVSQQPRRQFHPVWNIVDRALGIAVPAYFGFKNSEVWADTVSGVAGVVAGIDRADNSINVNGNLGDTRGDTAGRDLAGRDIIDDRSIGGDDVDIGRDNRVGDDFEDTCIGDACRNDSPGPIDRSVENRNSNNENTPVPEPDPEPNP